MQPVPAASRDIFFLNENLVARNPKAHDFDKGDNYQTTEQTVCAAFTACSSFNKPHHQRSEAQL